MYCTSFIPVKKNAVMQLSSFNADESNQIKSILTQHNPVPSRHVLSSPSPSAYSSPSKMQFNAM